MHRHPPAPPSAWRALLAATGTIAVVGLASGLTLPLVSVRLVEAGANASTVALIAALPALGVMCASFLLPTLTRRLGPRPLLGAAIVLSCVSLLIVATPYAAWSWMLSRLMLGVAAGVLFALGEARILEISGSATRGRWTGLYASTLTTCQFAGPTLLAILGTRSARALLVGVVLHGLSLLLLFGSDWPQTSAAPSEPLQLRLFMRCCRPLAIAVLFFSMFDSTMLALLPVYGLHLGLESRTALLMVTTVFLGDACLQIPLGAAADRFGRRGAHALCAVLAASAAVALPLGAVRTVLMWPSLFLLGGSAGALYTLAIVRLGDRFHGAALIAANAYVGLLWGVGSLSGPLLGGGAMALSGPQGLLLFVAAGAALTLLAIVRERTVPARSAAAWQATPRN
jgi:MFS family permease